MKDVIIVGAGLCGLAIARTLHAQDRRVCVLEARDRAGGRILSSTDASDALDLGPSWIWPGQARTAALTRELGLELFAQPTRGDLVYDDGSGRPQRGRFDAHGGALRTVGGVGSWIRGLVRALPDDVLRLGHRVRGARDEGDQVVVEVETANGPSELRARRLVIAVPPRVLLGMDMKPDLDEGTRAALARTSTWMAGEAKLLALYDEPFWRAAGLSGDAFSPGLLGQVWDASGREGSPALGAFLRMDALARRQRGRSQLEADAVAQLEGLFGPPAGRPRQVLLQDWFEEDLTATPADAQRPAGHPNYGLPFEPVFWDGRLVLSGTELAPEHGGYLEGALAAGEAAVAALQP